MSVKDGWPPKRPGPTVDRDRVTRHTLRAGIRAPPPEKPYLRIGAWVPASQVGLPADPELPRYHCAARVAAAEVN